MANKFKTFTAGAVLTAADQNEYLMNQVNVVCDAAADYPSAPPQGMTVYDKALNRELRYNGFSWLFTDLQTKPPGCQLTASSAQSIPNSTYTFVTFNVETRDTDTFHSTSVNTERITIPTGMSGYYLWVGTAAFAASAAGDRILTTGFGASGAALSVGTTLVQVSGQPFLTATKLIQLSAGDNVGMFVYQSSGGALNTVASSCHLSLTHVARI